MRALRVSAACSILLASLSVARAESAPAGPDRNAGRVEFASSGAPAAQEDFLYGLAQLHNFEYETAAAAFRRAQEKDPGFALAFWGEAMTHTHPIWMEQDREEALKVLARLAATPEERAAKAPTEREKAYLHAVEILYGEGEKEARDLRYAASMAELSARYPEDVDAAAFYALSLLGTAHAGRDFGIYMRAAGVLEERWASRSDHPGLAHYLIHSYDDAIHAPLGLRAARVYAKIAPGAAHAQHMTSHILLALGMWPETVAANEAALAAMNAGRAEHGLHHRACGHYAFWLEYGYLQQGRFAEARQMLEGCRAEAGPGGHAVGSDPLEADRSSVGSYAVMWARYLLDGAPDAAEVAAWELPATELAGPKLTHAFASAFLAARRGDLAAVRADLDRLREARRGVEAVYAEKKLGDPSYAKRAEALQLQIEALAAGLEGKAGEALARLEEAVAIEESLPFGFGPPLIDKPGHELLGEVLLARGEVAKAQPAFERALARAPGRRQAVAGLAAAAARLAGAGNGETKPGS